MTMATPKKESIGLEIAYSCKVLGLSSCWEAWQHEGRHGAREVAESSTSRSTSNRNPCDSSG